MIRLVDLGGRSPHVIHRNRFGSWYSACRRHVDPSTIVEVLDSETPVVSCSDCHRMLEKLEHLVAEMVAS